MGHAVRLWAGLVAAALAGCAGYTVQGRSSFSPQPTAVANVDTVIPNVTRKTVADRIVASKLEQGWQIRAQYDYGLSVGQRLSKYPMASMLFGSAFDGTPELRYAYNFVDVPGGVRIFARSEIVTNPGTGLERITDITSRYADELQSDLARLRASLGR